MEITKARVEYSFTVLLASNLVQSQTYYEKALGCEVNEHWAIRDDFGLGFKLIQAFNLTASESSIIIWHLSSYVS
jgi:lactoylglutathione lyase